MSAYYYINHPVYYLYLYIFFISSDKQYLYIDIMSNICTIYSSLQHVSQTLSIHITIYFCRIFDTPATPTPFPSALVCIPNINV